MGNLLVCVFPAFCWGFGEMGVCYLNVPLGSFRVLRVCHVFFFDVLAFCHPPKVAPFCPFSVDLGVSAKWVSVICLF